MDDDANETRDFDAELYENDPSLLAPTPGAEVRRLPTKAKRLGGAIPVRFTDDTVERVKQVAKHDGMSVSAWIRSEVERSLDLREGRTLTMATVTNIDPAGIEREAQWQRQMTRHG